MGAVAVHQHRNCLMHQQHHALPFLTPSPFNNPHKNARSLNGHKHNHLPRPTVPPSKTTPLPPNSSENLLMGQVKILSRGEELPGPTEEASKGLLPLPLPHKEFVTARRVNGFYAGSAAFVASPPPSSVPLPGFFAKRDVGVFSACDSATNDLRRILRLD